MLVVVAGMQRSGSTFSYNVARELLESRGGVSSFATNTLIDALLNQGDSQHTIIKSHSPDDLINSLLRNNAVPCICTVRKPEDAIASWMRAFKFSLEESVSIYRQWLIWHQKMHQHMLNIRYEEIDVYPYLTVRKISKYLLRRWGVFETTKIWWRNRKKRIYIETKEMKSDNKVNIGFSYYDKSTFYHRRHVSSLNSKKANELLSVEEIKYLRDELTGILDANGFYRW